jgi:DNA primase
VITGGLVASVAATSRTDLADAQWAVLESLLPDPVPVVRGVARAGVGGQPAALELDVPQWTVGAGGTPQLPDPLMFDLDPGRA